MTASWDRCYRRHFGTYLGKPFDVQTYRPDADSPPLQVAIFDRRYPGVRVFASVGLTAYASDVKETGEVVVLADHGWKEVPFLFVNALLCITRNRIPLASRFAVGGVANLAPEFADQYDKAALYFALADGFDPGFEKVECDGGVGLVFEAQFISEAEEDFLKRSGAEALEEKLRAQQAVSANPSSLLRPSCV
jgi:hypothetical protein